MTSEAGYKRAEGIIREVGKVVVGKDGVLIKSLLAILAGGHILMEDIPGVGKTTMAVAFSRALGLDYNRVQFTPDVLPSDITGYSIYDKGSGSMLYQPGAVLTNLFLADELNRATSRTQSALLEAMEEGQVTVDGRSYAVPQPFVVIATQNPTGAKGTQMLPDSQLDRFMLRLSMGYPSRDNEIEMIRRKQDGLTMAAVEQIADKSAVMDMRREAESVYIKDVLISYIIDLVSATRSHPMIAQGASPRASVAVTAMAKATAWIQGRDYVLPRDVRFVFRDTVEHRLLWLPEAEAPERHAGILDELLSSVPAPKIG